MAVDELVVDALLEQRDRLLDKLAAQRELTADLWAWYRGKQAPPDAPSGYQRAYQLLLDHSTTPWARLVVDAIGERLHVQGIRAGDDTEAAREAWRAWNACRLNSDQRLVYTEALVGGVGYVSVSRQEDGEVLVTPESAFEVTHEPDLARRQDVAAALKVYPLEWTNTYWGCELYRREATYRWIAEAPPGERRDPDAFPIDTPRHRNRVEWEERDPVENPVNVVPIVAFESRAGVLSGGVSEIRDCVSILRRIDRLTLDMLLTSNYSSFRQKWATGLVVPKDPDTGKPVEPYSAAVQRLWVSENPETRFGTFEASDLGQYLSAIDSQISALAAITRVPAHYLLQRNLANPPSAESLIASETGLASKVEGYQSTFGEAWEVALWLEARLGGREVALEEFEIDWASAEKRNPAQVADSAVKWQTMGVPQAALWAYGGFTPQQIEEWEAENAAADLLAAAAAPEPITIEAPAGAGVPG